MIPALVYLIGFPLTVLVIGMVADRLTYGSWIDLRWWK